MPKKSINDIRVPTYDDLFTNEEQRQEAKLEKIMEVPVEDIQEFKNHPFRVRNDEQMSELVKSISENGILVPVLIRPHPNGHGYEMISGHRRMNAAMVNGQEKIQAIVRELTDDQATIIMVDSNIQRENILPTERGFAYKMKLDAMIRQSGRPKDNGSQVGNHLKGKKSIEVLAEEERKSKNQIHRFIRLTELIEPLRDMVDGIRSDGKKIAFNPAVELSYLSKENQQLVVKNIEGLDLTPSHAQTIRMKELSRENRLDENVIYSIMTEEKANQKEKLSFKMEDINEYFPKNYTPREKSEVILKLLKGWAKRRNKEQER
ncbi:ParB/RepB/Spo0J family partition protein [Coprobacillus sp. AM29-13]|jgi:ParB family chromosome partitioning protein|uniref:Chromosome partitioning protein ParB n=1 Tax=Faecalibacillus intestinalis TaxID=1982626 RepID=A0A2T3FX45_9FIRM|nr:ParB/RepB/Spo0J family partition protein [Faecalibacillus intestinalis]RHH11264.1 ParB/RepB/Spo0J family partition protein [Coprobacillus sp. AM18-4LB-d2]RHQ20996.1 ParB/RepB/Spo0J family partition protein [Coprobacillus sp. AF29-3BH]RHR11492.1 ParB/RepB/Spo0J family partition protein [Coprobacillus sp. AF19-3]RHT50529.1 ParB/RepB/Spo0J family partition protein [Coprobacillus sp. AM29-13]MCB8592510.1 ParB/RepB/Spo0J family partition protein [Faecalibacillus intestinalis]